ncbi:putative DNA-binding transcriptional regulator YafY [Nocardia mexicana]|uniref:Putative DNA-binding transcriptional regulator YafY n=2 Tax=Nocardia mexicana TaxID=279262 RepID=A0A370H0I2_9NOCA|nr:putative DNA-binding transcriptional regulator YafY [Nocardia mexicana]
MPGRLLRLLSLLQSRREWQGAELTDRLGISARTLRRDIDRLRALDYPVDSTSGTAGGYRLTSGRNLPPLLLDDEEAIAVAIGLITAADVGGIEESSMRALAKLDQVLPVRLRPRLAALADTAVALPARPGVAPDPATLATLASCCRESRVVNFDYRGRGEAPGARRAEPHHLVVIERRWYLIAHDIDRADWRIFRVDRIDRPVPAHARFVPRPLPARDPADYLTRSLARATYRHTARLAVPLDVDTLRAKLFAPVPGSVDPDGPNACTVRLSADSAELVTQYVAAIAALDTAVELLDASDEVAEGLRRSAERTTRLP